MGKLGFLKWVKADGKTPVTINNLPDTIEAARKLGWSPAKPAAKTEKSKPAAKAE